MNHKLKIHLAGISLIALILLIGNFTISQKEYKIAFYISGFGFLALLSIIFVLAIPIMARLLRNNFTIGLLANRRWIGIYTFIFALSHVFLVYNNVFNWDFNAVLENPNWLYLTLGTIAFFILTAMALTSNDLSVRLLGRNWKRLHMLVYIALILVIIHSLGIGAIFMKNTFIKVIIFLLIAFVLIKKFKPLNL